jgi:hypothetical protein
LWRDAKRSWLGEQGAFVSDFDEKNARLTGMIVWEIKRNKFDIYECVIGDFRCDK